MCKGRWGGMHGQSQHDQWLKPGKPSYSGPVEMCFCALNKFIAVFFIFFHVDSCRLYIERLKKM